MKKFLPFVFPFIALLIVIFLAVRWYNSRVVRTNDNGRVAEFGEGVKIEDLTPSEVNKLKTPARDEKTVQLTGGKDMNGQVRYEIKDGKVSFSVNADLPTLKDGLYQVWLRQVGGEAKKKAFILEETKGGYIGTAAISADLLPFEVVVTKEMRNDDTMEETVLKGVIEKNK